RADPRAPQRQIVHEASRVEHEADDGANDLLAVDRTVDADRNDRHRTVDADFPSRPAPEPVERVLGHEHDDNRAVLHAELKTERSRDQIVVALDLLLIEQDALAIFAADADAG